MYPQQLSYQQYYQHKANASQPHPIHSMPKPNHSAADKRVLSILRNSLETKNANQQRLIAVSWSRKMKNTGSIFNYKVQIALVGFEISLLT